MNITIKDCQVTLTAEEWADFVDTAGYGINYWAEAPCIVDAEALTYTVKFPGTSEDPGDYGDPTSTYEITKEALEAAIARSIREMPWRAANYGDGGYDAEDADVAIQIAIFGKVVYG